jgi:SNF2 family DNA or RNA helicase
MELYKDKAIIVNTTNPDLILEKIEKSKLVKTYDNGVSQVIVNWGLDEVLELSSLKLKNPPSPINKEYEWPGIFKPFKHQVTTSEFLSAHKRAYCLNEAGTGKTSSVIWAYDYLKNKNKVNRMLVICPLSIMQPAWQADFFKTAMHRTVGVAHGTTEQRKKVFKENTDVVIINYDGVNIMEKEIIKGNFDLIVIDEANYIKNVKTRRWKSINKIIDETTWVWLLTGTPACQSPFDAYGLAKLINPNSVPRYAGTFKDMVMQKISQFTWVARPQAEAIVHKTLQPAVRFEKRQCLDLPDIMYTERDVELTLEQKTYYNKLKKEMIIEIGQEEVSAVNAATMLTKLLQVSSGAAYTADRSVVEFDYSSRYNVLKEIIEEASQKVIIFCAFRSIIDKLTDKLTKDKISCDSIHGGVSAGRRTQIIKNFQEKESPRILIIQPQAASHGITLHAANVAVFWTPVVSVETYIQCCARIDRAGQKNPMTVVHLQGSPVEKKIYKYLSQKIKNHDKLIDLFKEEIGI